MAFIVWFALGVAALALQSSFFTVPDYLEVPMWTAHMYPIVRFIDLILVVLTGAGMWVLVPASLGAGIVILARPRVGLTVRRLALLAQALPLAAFLAHSVLLSVAHLGIRGTLPPSFPLSAGMVVASVGLPGAALFYLLRRLPRASFGQAPTVTPTPA